MKDVAGWLATPALRVLQHHVRSPIRISGTVRVVSRLTARMRLPSAHHDYGFRSVFSRVVHPSLHAAATPHLTTMTRIPQ